ncbi:hypothetical protein [Rubritalea marina]|uniref:hypothetical protein n=1 Tax=Rubritalea marina TaxID=361055 RepID=UPI000381D2FC|nr:hypothetical protein [Rubritalea marina]
MWKLIIIFSALPFVVAGFAANALGLRILLKPATISMELDVFIHKLLLCMQREDIQVVYEKRQLWPKLSVDKLYLPESYRASKRVSHAGLAAQRLGVVLLGEQQPDPVRWRERMLKLGYTLPVFALLVVSFGFLVGKLPTTILLAVIAATLGFVSVMLGLSMGVDREAAYLMVTRLEKLRVLPRLSEEEAVVEAIKAAPWASLMPGAFLKLTLKD